MIFTLPLKKNEDFRKVYKKRQAKSDSYFIMYTMYNSSDFNRLGISVSKKVGNSVIRHRIKRLIKENYRATESKLKSGYDIVLMAKQGAKDIDFYGVKNSVNSLLKRQKLISKS